MAKTTESAAGGIGFGGLLTLLFIGLKLTGHIGWSWLWVLAPIWIPILIALVIIAFALAMWILTGQARGKP